MRISDWSSDVCSSDLKLPTAPLAPPRTYSYERHGYTVDDPWFWLKDPGYPKVEDKEILDYLKAENAYFETAMEPHKPLVRTLFEEMKGRIKEDDKRVDRQSTRLNSSH